MPFPRWSPTESAGCSSISLRVTWHFQRDARTLLRSLPDQRQLGRSKRSLPLLGDRFREEASCPASAGPKLPEKRSNCSAHLPTWLLPPQVTARSRQVHFRNGREKARARSSRADGSIVFLLVGVSFAPASNGETCSVQGDLLFSWWKGFSPAALTAPEVHLRIL